MRSADLQYPRGLHDRGLSLPLGKFGRFGAVGINPAEALAVLVEYGDLPVFVLAAFIFAQLGMFACGFRFGHKCDYLNRERRAQVPVRVLRPDQSQYSVLL